LKSVLFGQDYVQYDTLRMLPEDFFKSFIAINGRYYLKAAIA
jgi:hypothetical protein